jgi:hypothetical protein
VPQAFPDDYLIPNGTECVVENGEGIKVGTKGTAMNSEKRNEFYNTTQFHHDDDYTVFRASVLAPLNPEQHPEHPNFKHTTH